MATLNPLQLIAAGALLNNQGIVGLPSSLTSAISAVNSTTVIANFINAVNFYLAQTWSTTSTLNDLLTIGNSVCPALGNSIPVAFTNLSPSSDPPGFSGLIEQTGLNYLGNGDLGSFAQGFMAVNGWIQTTNDFINSVINAQTYLGPTFDTMDALVTNNISNVNSNFPGFSVDLLRQGQLWNLADLENYGTPAGLLRQLAAVGRLQGGTLPVVQSQLLAIGLSATNIAQLITGQGSLNPTQFNQLQQLAYLAMTQVKGADLQQVLTVLSVTTPNLLSMADLLNPVKTFPNSYSTLKTTSLTDFIPIYGPGTSVRTNVASAVSQFLPTPSGCDELAKVIPPDQAVANKAIQVALQQITGISRSTLQRLAEAVQGATTRAWNPALDYLANDLVQTGQPLPVYYRAQQNVPAGINITDSTYWLPTTLGGLNTMTGLPDIQSLTEPVPPSTVNFFETSIATGSGPNGTINLYDVLGLAVDYDSTVSDSLNSSVTAINALQTAGSLATLNTAYTNMLTAINDSQMQTYIANANSAISALSGDPNVTVLNTLWDTIATVLSQEKTYQTLASIDYANLQTGDNASIFALVQQLNTYGLDVDTGGACEFLNELSDLSIIGGQAIVGAMRQGQNSLRLNNALLGININPSAEPAVLPAPAVTPSN